MRTTLSIDDDVLETAKAIAKQRAISVGKVVSELARRSLRPPVIQEHRSGFLLLPVYNEDAVVTLDVVNALRDELP